MKVVTRIERGWFPFQIPENGVPKAHRLVRNTLLICRERDDPKVTAVIVATIGGLFETDVPDVALPEHESRVYRSTAGICDVPQGFPYHQDAPELFFINNRSRFVIDLSESSPELVLADFENMTGGNQQHEYAVDLVYKKLMSNEVAPKDSGDFVPVPDDGGAKGLAYDW